MADWQAVADELNDVCPEPFYRSAAARILQKVEGLGPLGAPTDEFKRVYRFIHYNEPHRVEAVADELLTALLRRQYAGLPASRNAWSYVVGAYDHWILRARVFYLVAGVIEGTLRTRLNARLTDLHGPEWFTHEGIVPSGVRLLADRESALRRLVNIQTIVEDANAEGVTDAIRAALLPPSVAATNAAEYVETLTFGALVTFFDTKRLWSTGPRLEEIFGPPSERPLRQALVADLVTMRNLRNDVAHYRPQAASSFQRGLFAASRLAMWLGVDLQHVYGSIDTRLSTELSLLVDAVHPTAASSTVACLASGCSAKGPLDVFLQRSPRNAEEIPYPLEYACLFHRVAVRATLHRTPLAEPTDSA